MKSEEIKDLLISSLDPESDSGDYCDRLEKAGVLYDFKSGFRSSVVSRIFGDAKIIKMEQDFSRLWNTAFYRIAFTGVAAIVILLISIYLSEGSFSFNSLLGLNSGSDESIVGLLTGN